MPITCTISCTGFSYWYTDVHTMKFHQHITMKPAPWMYTMCAHAPFPPHSCQQALHCHMSQFALLSFPDPSLLIECTCGEESGERTWFVAGRYMRLLRKWDWKCAHDAHCIHADVTIIKAIVTSCCQFSLGKDISHFNCSKQWEAT